jgi:hypothetical protein
MSGPPEPEPEPGSDAVARAHADAIERGAEAYRDPATGYLVLTAATLLARGECCGFGCRHCPYPPDEQRRAGRPAPPQ